MIGSARRVGALVVLAVAGLSTAGCAGNGSPRVATVAGAGPQVAQVRDDVVPATLAELAAAPEDISKLEKKAGPDSWLADARLWSLRTGKQLRATIEVGRFVPDADVGDRNFQERIVTQIGSAAARTRTLGSTRVYVTSGNQQLIYVWFRRRHFVVLSIATDYARPREVLRAALELQP